MNLSLYRDKRIIIYVKKVSGTYTQFKRKRIKGIPREVGYRKDLKQFDISTPSYRIRNKWFYFVDLDTGQLSFQQSQSLISSQLLKAIMKQELGRQLVAGLTSKPMFENLLLLALGIGLGIAVGFIIGNFVPISEYVDKGTGFIQW